MKLFTQSQRVYDDLSVVLEGAKKQSGKALDQTQNLDFFLVIREWQEIPVDMEFRAFCKDGKITALSQYDAIVYFERFSEPKILSY